MSKLVPSTNQSIELQHLLFRFFINLDEAVKNTVMSGNKNTLMMDSLLNEILSNLVLSQNTEVVNATASKIMEDLRDTALESLNAISHLNNIDALDQESKTKFQQCEQKRISVLFKLIKYIESVTLHEVGRAPDETDEVKDDLFLTTLLLKDFKNPDKIAARYEWYSVNQLNIMYIIPGDLMNHFLHPTSSYVVRKRFHDYDQKKNIYTFVCDVDKINVLVRKNYMDKLESIVLEYNTKN